MTAAYFPAIDTWAMSAAAVEASLGEMARDGARGTEGVVLWLGRRQGGTAEITHLVALRGTGIVKRPDLLIIHHSLLNEVADVAIDLGVSLLGQVHSHGPGATTDLSRLDRAEGLAVPYYLSVVAPDYALRAGTRLTDCGIHVYEPGVGYRRLPPPEVATRVRVLPGPRPPLLTIGEPEEGTTYDG
jgi:proteasome lid subunit RPN8/RPN11